MRITPYDIHNKEFRVVFRGYDRDQVEDFLDKLIEVLETSEREKLALEQAKLDLEQRVQGVPARPMEDGSAYTGVQPAVNAAGSASISTMELRVAREVADEVRLNAKKEAELIVKEAQKNADRIVNDAMQKSNVIESRISELSQVESSYKARLIGVIRAHWQLLSSKITEGGQELEGLLSNNLPAPVNPQQQQSSAASSYGRLEEEGSLGQREAAAALASSAQQQHPSVYGNPTVAAGSMPLLQEEDLEPASTKTPSSKATEQDRDRSDRDASAGYPPIAAAGHHIPSYAQASQRGSESYGESDSYTSRRSTTKDKYESATPEYAPLSGGVGQSSEESAGPLEGSGSATSGSSYESANYPPPPPPPSAGRGTTRRRLKKRAVF